MLAGISAGETIWCGLSAFLSSTKLSSSVINLLGNKYHIDKLLSYKHGFVRRLFLYILAMLINTLLSLIFYTTDIIPMTIWVVFCHPLVINKIISCKWFADIEANVITYYLSIVVNYLIKHGLDIHTQIQNTEIRNIISNYYHGETTISLANYTSPVSVVKFIYKSIRTISTDDTKRIIAAIKKSDKIDPVLLWSIYKVWRKKQNFTSIIKSLDKHIGYHVLEYTAIYAALWFINIYAAVATLFAINAISKHRNAAMVHKYNVVLSLVAVLIYQAQIYATITSSATSAKSNFIVDNIVCVLMSSGCVVNHLMTHYKPSALSIRITSVVKSSWLWPVLALVTGQRFAVVMLVPKFYAESSHVSWYTIGVLMCGYFSNFTPLHILILYIAYIAYTVNFDAAVLLRATKVIANYTPEEFNARIHSSGIKEIGKIIDNYV